MQVVQNVFSHAMEVHSSWHYSMSTACALLLSTGWPASLQTKQHSNVMVNVDIFIAPLRGVSQLITSRAWLG